MGLLDKDIETGVSYEFLNQMGFRFINYNNFTGFILTHFVQIQGLSYDEFDRAPFSLTFNIKSQELCIKLFRRVFHNKTFEPVILYHPSADDIMVSLSGDFLRTHFR